MNAAVSLMDGLGLDGDRCIHVIPRHPPFSMKEEALPACKETIVIPRHPPFSMKEVMKGVTAEECCSSRVGNQDSQHTLPAGRQRGIPIRCTLLLRRVSLLLLLLCRKLTVSTKIEPGFQVCRIYLDVNLCRGKELATGGVRFEHKAHGQIVNFPFS